jgi:hypothetical protein
MTQIIPLLYALNAADAPKAWDLIARLHPGRWREDLQRNLVRAWSLKEPRSALAAVLAEPHGGFRRGLVDDCLTVWTRQEPANALAWALGRASREERQAAVTSVIFVTAFENPAGAVPLLTNLPAGRARNSVASVVACELASTDLQTALATLNQVQGQPRLQALCSIAGAQVNADVDEALRWGRDLPNPEEREVALSTVIDQIARTSSPGEAQAIFDSESDPALRAALAKSLAGAWAAVDLEAAQNWVSQLPDGPALRQAWSGVCGACLYSCPDLAAEFALTLPEGPTRDAGLKQAEIAWAASLFDPVRVAEASEWASNLPPGHDRDTAIAALLSVAGLVEPEQAGPLASSISADQARNPVVRAIAQEWAQNDPGAAAAWSSSLPGSGRTEAMQTVASLWAGADPSSAGQWLSSLPPDDARTAAVEAYLGATATALPQLAAGCIGLIPNEQERDRQTEIVAARWIELDPEAALTWLQQTALPVDRKQQLIQGAKPP